jgi:hypothetical protein
VVKSTSGSHGGSDRGDHVERGGQMAAGGQRAFDARWMAGPSAWIQKGTPIR